MTPASSPRVAILTGPTATGKTALAIGFAERLAREKGQKLEVVNADSLLVYRGLDIATAKPTADERARVAHRLIDVREPDQPFTAGDFVREVRAAIDEIHGSGGRALIAGGTGFYLKALLYGLWEAPRAEPVLRRELEARETEDLYQELYERDPESALRITRSDRYRLIRAHEILRTTGLTPTELQARQPKEPDAMFDLWVIDRPGEELPARIEARTRAMLDAGLLDETRRVRERYPNAAPLKAVGYAECCRYLDGAPPEGRKPRAGLDGLRDEISLATRQLVKRQRTWFRAEGAATWFELDRQRDELERAFERVYL